MIPPRPERKKVKHHLKFRAPNVSFCSFWMERELSEMACVPLWTTLKYKSSAVHLSFLCIWSFLPLSCIQLTTGCWKVLSAISLSVITTVALCSDLALGWKSRGPRRCLLLATSLLKKMMFRSNPSSFFWVAVSNRNVWTKKNATWQRFSAKLSQDCV